MKTTMITRLAVILVIISLGGHRTLAQQTEVTPEEAPGAGESVSEFEEAQRRALELQERKLMLEKARMEQEMKMRKEEIEIARQRALVEAEARERERDFERQRVIVRSGEGGNYSYVMPHGYGNQAQITLRNTFQGGSDSSQGEFEVDKDTRVVQVLINGKVKSGDITIKILYPKGDVFKDLTINSSAEISFNQSMSLKDGEESKYTGTWKYEVEADKAEGNYLLQISTR
jgi:hypothetical protein